METQCSVCHKRNSRLLMLSCGHDPCIDCAVTHFFAEARSQKQLQSLREANYWCKICCEPTVVEYPTIQELFNYYGEKSHREGTATGSDMLQRSKSDHHRRCRRNEKCEFQSPEGRIPMKSGKKEKRKSSHHHAHAQQAVPTSKQSIQNSNRAQPQQRKLDLKHSLKDQRSSSNFLFQSIKSSPSSYLTYPPCLKHSDQVLSFYCFTCSCNICVECALHGSHVGHQVEAIKKAGNRLKIHYEKLISQSQKNRTNLENNVKDLDQIINNYKIWNERHRISIRQKFAELYQVLAERQKIILTQIENIENENLNILIQEKNRYEDTLLALKSRRKQLKYSISIPPMDWDINELEKVKNEVKSICESNLLQHSVKKLENSVRYVQTDLLVQTIDGITDLVSKFEVSYAQHTAKSS